ncbi:MAG TPA: hypothetical protein VHY08_05720, partial [Bacillota bacterium]|nr:hypothetical protein [Bacillota bacterium]
TLAKIPEFFGYHLFQQPMAELFYFKNLSLFVLPLFAVFFLVKRKPGWKLSLAVLGSFLIAALLVNLYPFLPPKNTELLTGIHLPILVWLITGIAYMGVQWRTVGKRMDFIRFTGETVIYTGLVFCGVVVLGLFTAGIFAAIQVKVEGFVREYLLVYGGCAAVLITGYLVEAKKSVVENFAPILAKIFSPLFFLAMVIFLLVMVIMGKSPFVDRNFLIGFDLMLALVLGLVLYVISARGIHEKCNYFDYLNLALILVALIIDGIALSAIVFRLSSFGISPNKLAALGENLVLLFNLSGLAWYYLRFLLKKGDFGMLEKWQTVYLYVYAGWMVLVAFLFPVFFGFR